MIAAEASASAPSGPHQFDYPHRLDADAGDLLEEMNHVLLVLRKTVSVEFLPNAQVLRRLFLVLVENPFQRRAVAELISFSPHSTQRQKSA